MIIPLPFSLILIGIAGVFGSHLLEGWRTEVVRFPLSILVFHEFERERAAANYWGVMMLDGIGAVAALSLAVVGLIQGQW